MVGISGLNGASGPARFTEDVSDRASEDGPIVRVAEVVSIMRARDSRTWSHDRCRRTRLSQMNETAWLNSSPPLARLPTNTSVETARELVPVPGKSRT